MKLFERVSNESAIVVILVVLAICARLLSFGYLSSLASTNPAAHPYPVVSGDSSYYALWADNLLEFHAYENPKGVPLHAAPPGYPALLAATKALTGSMAPIVILQIILSAYAAVLIYRMARTLVPSAYALVPALAYAIDPMAVFTDSAIMTDGLFSSLLIFIVYFAFFLPTPSGARQAGQQSRLKGIARWGLVGLLLGAITMIRPIAQFLVFVFPAMYLLREWFTVSSSNPMASKKADPTVVSEKVSRLKVIIACILGFAVIVTPWIARNYSQFESFEISPLGGHNLLINNVRGFLAWRTLAGTPEQLPAILAMRHFNDPVFSVVDTDVAKRLAEITPPGKDSDNYEGKLAIYYIMRDPVRYAYFHTVNTIPFFISSSVASYKQIERQLRDNEGFYAPVTLSILDSLRKIRHPESASSFISAVRNLSPIALEIFWWLCITLLALVATVLRRRDFAILLLFVLVAYFAALTGPMSNSRYRIPAEPYLLILAAAGAHELVKRMRKHYGH
ncbi:MAG: hypothetical protein Q7S01_05840 [bacterium]|nr:hypothetical protein [bacterium]